ncbi:hypothetical protein JI50_004719 [Salmonella enterica]|nr:hypothetical protein [Salmonella enterica]
MFEVLLCRANLPDRYRKNNSDDRTEQDRMCNCNTVTRDAITIAIWSGLHPDTLLV